MVLEFPPSESFSNHVSTESLYGIKTELWFLLRVSFSDRSAEMYENAIWKCTWWKRRLIRWYFQIIPSWDMTLPRVTRDLLMLPPSFNLTPVAPVAVALSLNKNKVDIVKNGICSLTSTSFNHKQQNLTYLPARSTRWILLCVSLGVSLLNLACKY